jgi:hypothetical protein
MSGPPRDRQLWAGASEFSQEKTLGYHESKGPDRGAFVRINPLFGITLYKPNFTTYAGSIVDIRIS